MRKNKINEMSVKRLLSLEDKVDSKTFNTYIQKYLNNRFNKRKHLNNIEIEQLNIYSQLLYSNNMISSRAKERLKRNIIRLVVLSKNINNLDFINKLSDLESLSKEDLYLYLETTIKYIPSCLSKEHFIYILSLFKNDYEYLMKVRNLLVGNKLDSIADKEIDRITKQKINKSNLILLLKNDNYNEFVNISSDSYNYPDERLPLIRDKNIITIDDSISPDLDGAFSIEKIDDLYYLNIYVTDVPSLLLLNEDLLKMAFDRSTSMYNHQNKEKLLIRDMLPPSISHDSFSLRKNNYRNVITFSYCIDEKGNVNLEDVSRNLVFINDNISPEVARRIISSNSSNNETQNDLKLYSDLCKLICKNSNERLLQQLNTSSISDIVSVSSIITNYHVGRNSKLAIYRTKGLYTKQSIDKYTHSVTPLRKFVSDINLISYLNQLGLINCPDKYIYYIEDNLDYIIEHLNEQDKMSRYFEKQYKLVKQYYNQK